MTDFLAWWADHWPLVPILVLYPVFNEWLGTKTAFAILNWHEWKRRREP